MRLYKKLQDISEQYKSNNFYRACISYLHKISIYKQFYHQIKFSLKTVHHWLSVGFFKKTSAILFLLRLLSSSNHSFPSGQNMSSFFSQYTLPIIVTKFFAVGNCHWKADPYRLRQHLLRWTGVDVCLQSWKIPFVNTLSRSQFHVLHNCSLKNKNYFNRAKIRVLQFQNQIPMANQILTLRLI